MNAKIFKTILFSAVLLMFYGCETVSFFGKTNAKIKNDVVYQTIQWDANASSADVEREFRAFVRETLTKHRYKNYVQLFQSNYFMEEGERTYVIKIFKNEQEKNLYQRYSDDIISRSIALASKSFSNRWSQLQQGMIVEDVYNLLPELADFNAKQIFYNNRSELQLSDKWLSFDFTGRLLNFGTGNVRTSAPRNEEWVF